MLYQYLIGLDTMISELNIGKAGEHLVCSDLLLKGFDAYLSDQGLPYDVICDVSGRLIKIQVKTSMLPTNPGKKSTPSYLFSLKYVGKGRLGKFKYNFIDMFALVALDELSIGYILPKYVKNTITIRAEKYRKFYFKNSHNPAPYMKDLPFEFVLNELITDNIKFEYLE